jgi:molybdopterin-guanine dinucleotide biosynthesis adapter protein
MQSFPVPLLGFAAFSGTGKTTLLKQLIPRLRERSLRVGVIKHTHHQIEVDRPGKDSYELRKSGADRVLLASSRNWALMADEPEEREPSLPQLLQRLDIRNLDLVLVEGFRHLDFPKIELHRPSLGKPLIYPEDPCVIAIASDLPLVETNGLPCLDLNDIPAVLHFILTDFLAKSD